MGRRRNQTASKRFRETDKKGKEKKQLPLSNKKQAEDGRRERERA